MKFHRHKHCQPATVSDASMLAADCNGAAHNYGQHWLAVAGIGIAVQLEH